MFDSHVHSNFSGDCEMDAEIAINKSLEIGLEGLSFTDHLDYDYPDYDDVFLIDFEKYSDYFDSLKLKYKNKIKVSKGIEIGLQPHVIDDTLKVVNAYNFDFVIYSIHVVDKLDLHNGDFCKNKTKAEAYSRYFQVLVDTLSLYDNFDVIGHLDLIRRYGCYDNRTISYNDFIDILDTLLTKVISMGKGIEINASGFRYNLNSPMPDFEIVKRYKELGGEIITTGSDAHTVEYVGYKFNYLKELLNNAGFEYTAHFINRQPIFSKLI